MPTVPFEQAVYGSFPFWDRGYAVLAHSPGCRPEWLERLKAACQRLGEKPAGVGPAGGIFALRLPAGPWMVVGVSDQGADDRGRPGAMAFHALFLRPRDYRKAGCSPFPLAAALRSAWAAEVRTLPAGAIEVPPGEPALSAVEGARPIAQVIAAGRRVFLQADAPADALARAVWSALPLPARRRASVATWAFGNANRFDLVALPRLAGVEFDDSYRDARDLDIPPAPAGILHARSSRRRMVAAAGVIAIAGALTLAFRPGRGGSPTVPPADPPLAPIAVAPPDPAAYREDRPAPEDRRRVAEGLVDLADRCGVAVGDLGDDSSPLMARLADRLRYRGPLLSAADRARLAAEPEADRLRALAWDAQVRRFLPDRPLPRDFARGTLRWQLDALAWSFHLAPSRGPIAEAPDALADAFAITGPVRPGPLASRYPALADYARFLGRLPKP